MATQKEIDALADAMAQMLDDMGADGTSVCLAAKARARLAYERDKEIERYKRALGIAMNALDMYASPDSYFAIGFGFDRPCGDFADDFSRVQHSDYNRPMPGKVARSAIQKLRRSYGSLSFYTHTDAHQ